MNLSEVSISILKISTVLLGTTLYISGSIFTGPRLMFRERTLTTWIITPILHLNGRAAFLSCFTRKIQKTQLWRSETCDPQRWLMRMLTYPNVTMGSYVRSEQVSACQVTRSIKLKSALMSYHSQLIQSKKARKVIVAGVRGLSRSSTRHPIRLLKKWRGSMFTLWMEISQYVSGQDRSPILSIRIQILSGCHLDAIKP